MLYRLLKILLGLGMKLFYKEIRVVNKERLSGRGPRIIIANHPNTLMDAWIIGQLCSDQIYFMTKGTFFNTPLKKLFLRSIGLIPINRASDEKTKGVSNTDSFEECYQLLEEGKTLVIFPEGNSFAEKLLRKLKSGTARIALQTELRNQGSLGLKVIPVGLIYLQPEKFRSSVLTLVGEPIDPKPFLNEFKTDSLRAARQLTEEFRKGISALLVDSENKEQETFADQVIELLSGSGSEKGLISDVALIRTVNKRLNQIQRSEQVKLREIEELVAKIKWQLDRLQIKTEFFDRQYRFGLFFRQIVQSGLALVLGSPFFLFGVIHNIVPYKFTEWIMPKLVEDKEYYAPIAVLLGLVIYPINYTLFLLILNTWVDLTFFVGLLYFVAMPVSGLFAHYFYSYFNYVSIKWRFTQLMQNKQHQEILQELIQLRSKLKTIVLD